MNTDISVHYLEKDNHSKIADDRRKEFDSSEKKKNLILVLRCSDARMTIPYKGVTALPTIAAGGPVHAYIPLIQNKTLKCIIVAPHFDSSTFKKGKMPQGCGGLGAKEDHKHFGNKIKKEGIHSFVDRHVYHQDVILQGCISASKIALYTEKPVLAVAQDHLTGEMFPIAAFKNFGRVTVSSVPLRYLFHDQYDPERIYKNGIPTLSEEEIPQEFKEFLKNNKSQSTNLKIKYKDLKRRQKIQNPLILCISRNMRPMEVGYPNLTSKPGTVFRIRVPRPKGSEIKTDNFSLNNVVNQAHYPILHSVINAKDNIKPFSQMKRILIETESMKESEKILKKLKAQPWMQKWMNLPDHKIFLAQTNEGVIQKIKEVR